MSLSSNDASSREKEKQDLEQKLQTIEKEPYSYIPFNRKCFIVLIVSITGFIGPLSGNIYIPLIPKLSKDFDVSTSTINGTVSVFMIIFTFAPTLWASLSDWGGRKILFIYAMIIYIISNILMATLPSHIAVLYIFRIFQAIGTSTLPVGMGVVADLFEIKNRAKVVSYFLIGPQLGPILGPVLSLIGANSSWRWVFGFLAFFGFFNLLLVVFFLPETLRCIVGNSKNVSSSWINLTGLRKQECLIDETDKSKFPPPPKPSLKLYITILKQKNVVLCTITGSLAFAAFYSVLISFTSVLKEVYNYKQMDISVSYLCPGISLIVGSLMTGHLTDYFKKIYLSRNDEYYPEFRFIFQLVGTIILTAGLFGFGWCSEKKVHVATVFVFTGLSSFGVSMVMNCNTTYLLESSTKQPATFISIGNAGRNLGATISSAIIHVLVKRMGYGWCFSGLGFVCIFSFVLTVLQIYMGISTKRRNSLNNV